MNFSSANVTVVVESRDSISAAVTKNLIVVVLGVSINLVNATLIHTFNKFQILKTNPRYILFIHLVVNDMIQLTVGVTMFVVSYILYTINASVCIFLVLLAISTTENTPLNLACMAVECYIAICIPLRHVQICTVKRIYILIGLIWTISMASVLPDFFVALAEEPLEFFQTRVFCRRNNVCRNVHMTKKRSYYYMLLLVLVWLTLIYTYFKILFTAKAANSDAKKARNTILLHGFQLMLCMLGYLDPLVRLGMSQFSPSLYRDILFAFYIFFHILPRFISPIVYGVRDQTFRRYLKKSLSCRVKIHSYP